MTPITKAAMTSGARITGSSLAFGGGGGSNVEVAHAARFGILPCWH